MLLNRVGAATALVMVGAFFNSAQAAPITGGEGTKRLVDPYAMAEKAQVFVWGGRRHCFYDDAWNGPGWYWCDYAWRRGYGWGGRPGWHGWAYPNRHRAQRDGRRPRAAESGQRKAAPAERRGVRDGRSGRGDATQSRSARPDGARSGRSSVSRDGARSSGGRGVSSGRGNGDGSATSGRGGDGNPTSGRGGGGGEARGGGRGG